MKIPLKFSITRQELYDLVWSKQLGQVADELGIKKTDLCTLCLCNDVPRPSSLFWRHKAIGKPEEPEPLPEPDRNPEFEVNPDLVRINDPALRKETVLQIMRVGSSRLFKVREDLMGCHKLVSRTRKIRMASKKRKLEETPRTESTLDIGVSKPNIRRALLLFDALLKGLEGLGYWVGITEERYRNTTVIEVMGLKIQVSIREYDSIQVLEKYTKERSPDLPGDPIERRRIKLEPSGRLRFEIFYSEKGFGGRNTCYQQEQISETKVTPMEKRLKQVAVTVISVAARAIQEKAWRKKREEEEWEATKRKQEEEREATKRKQEEEREASKRKQEEERRRKAKWLEIMIEQVKVNSLIDESENWAKSNRLRDYIKAKKADYIDRGAKISPKSAAGKWIKWATDQADRLDPLKKSPPSLLDDEDKYSPTPKPKVDINQLVLDYFNR